MPWLTMRRMSCSGSPDTRHQRLRFPDPSPLAPTPGRAGSNSPFCVQPGAAAYTAASRCRLVSARPPRRPAPIRSSRFNANGPSAIPKPGHGADRRTRPTPPRHPPLHSTVDRTSRVACPSAARGLERSGVDRSPGGAEREDGRRRSGGDQEVTGGCDRGYGCISYHRCVASMVASCATRGPWNARRCGPDACDPAVPVHRIRILYIRISCVV